MAPVITTSARSNALNLQGIIVPQAAVDPEAFFRLTRRQRIQIKSNITWQGHGAREIVDLPAVGIVSALVVTVKGTITIATAAATPSYRWPYDLIKQITLSANGQSNLISVSGAKLKVREMMKDNHFTDRGVANNIGGTSRTQGTLALAAESWGMSPGNSTSTGTYTFELSFEVPVSFDQQYLTGAIFAQTSSTQLQMQIEWNTVAALVSTNPGNVTFSAVTYTVEGEIFPVPYDNGVAIVPDLSTFHFLTQVTDTKLAVGENEYRIMGQGIGKQLMRLYFQVWNNGINGQPLALSTANFPSVGWRFGGSEMPEKYLGGGLLLAENERNYNCPIGQWWGFASLDWAVANAFRDSIDEGLASELRFFFELASGTTVSAPGVEYVREELMAAPVAV